MDDLLDAIYTALERARVLAAEVGRGEGGRELALVRTKLEEAEMWAERARDAV